MRHPTFPIFGTAYYPEAVAEADWERDLRAMRAAGITCVRWGEFSWSVWELVQGRFSWDLSDRFIAAVERSGLELILCTPTATPPPWIIQGHPDWLMQDAHGRPHHGPRHYGCFYHPDFLNACDAIIAGIAERYGQRPFLKGWQIDNEPNIGECNQGNIYDYHPRAVSAFQRWCQQRYGSIAALTEAWQGHFWSRGLPDWSYIDPPRPGVGVVNHSAWLAWCRFRRESLAAFVHRQRDLLRRLTPDVSVGCNIPDVTPTTMVKLGQDYWAQARGLDWAATDLYAFKKDAVHERRYLSYETDLMRSALTSDGARFFIMETQGGPHNVPWRMDFVGGHFTPDYLDRCAQTYARGGAEGVCFFLWRPWLTGVECGMNGICAVDGSASERTRALPGIIERARGTISATAASCEPRPRLWMHYSASSLAIAAHTDPERTPDQSIPGWHALLSEAGFAVDFLDEQRLATHEWTASDCLVLPYSTVLSAQEIASILRLHTTGGRIICGYATGFFDHEGRIALQRPVGLTAILGLRQTACDHLDQAHAWTYNDCKITGNVCIIEQEESAVVIAGDMGQPLLLVGPSGRAWYCAIDLGSLFWTRVRGLEPLSESVTVLFDHK